MEPVGINSLPIELMGLIFEYALEEDLASLEGEALSRLAREKPTMYTINLALGRIHWALVSYAQVSKRWKKSLPCCRGALVPRLNAILTNLECAISLSNVITVTRALRTLCWMEAPEGASHTPTPIPLPIPYSGYAYTSLGPPLVFSVRAKLGQYSAKRIHAVPQVVEDLRPVNDEAAVAEEKAKYVAIVRRNEARHMRWNRYALLQLGPEWAKAEEDASLPGFLVHAVRFTGLEFGPLSAYAANCMRGTKGLMLLEEDSPMLVVRLYSLLSHRAYVLIHAPKARVVHARDDPISRIQDCHSKLALGVLTVVRQMKEEITDACRECIDILEEGVLPSTSSTPTEIDLNSLKAGMANSIDAATKKLNDALAKLLSKHEKELMQELLKDERR